MPIVACPKCNEEISLPNASPQAHVRCPLCQDEYQLREVLERLPPSLVVLDDPGGGSGGEPGGRHGDSAIHAFAAASGEAAPQAGGAAFDFQQGSAATATEAKPGVGVRPRPKRKPKKPAIEVLKIVGGGAVGILVAILLIWWIAGKDPFKLGPKIATFAPFLVPDDLEGPESEGASEKPPEKQPDDESPQRRPGGLESALPEGID